MTSEVVTNDIQVGEVWQAIQNPYEVQGLLWSIGWEIGKKFQINKIVSTPSNDKLISFALEGKSRGGWELSSETFLIGFKKFA